MRRNQSWSLPVYAKEPALESSRLCVDNSPESQRIVENFAEIAGLQDAQEPLYSGSGTLEYRRRARVVLTAIPRVEAAVPEEWQVWREKGSRPL